MNRSKVVFPRAFLSMLLLISLLLGSPSLWAESSFRVVTSIKPVHSILAALMIGTEGPELLVDGEALPFGYQLNESQKADVAGASLIVWVGPELEKFLIEPVAQAQQSGARVMTLLDDPELKILPSRWSKNDESMERDPFFWLDSRNTLILVDELARALMDADGARAHLYRRNRANLLARVAELDRRLEYGYRGLKSGIGMAYYDTLQYFEQAYALKIRGVLAQSPQQSVEAIKLLQSHAKLKEGYYACLLTERGMPMPELPLLTEGVEINIGILDSFGSAMKAGPELYFELMKNNTDTIKSCLQYSGDAAKLAAKEQYEPEVAKIGGKFMLIDQDGKLVTEKDMQGKFQLIYFGYTFCPDICPTSLQVMSLALDMLGDRADLIKPYFITVDPERDNAKVMKNYVQYFNQHLVGLTGTKVMIERVAKEFKVKYAKVIEPGSDPNLYIMDHSASVYLMAPNGEFITKFAHGISAKQMVEALNSYLPKQTADSR
ncbi:metal ABC transporter solute-binding protein, Zn/Mn family [Sedimenticola sp.]|uniref:metal ABC transporter solute-binding protein, Zn/Mn family n=1 Tax=Sedimenticola sp. TaxID=1940285 RepID=UPI003D11BE72